VSDREAPAGGAVPADEAGPALEVVAGAPLVVRRRGGRRVTTDPVPGSDPTPAPAPPDRSSGENDRQLRDDVPPHWG